MARSASVAYPRSQVSVYRTIGPQVLICDTEHRLWVHVLVRTAPICVLSIKKNINIFQIIFFFQLTAQVKICVSHGYVFVMGERIWWWC